MTLYRKNFPGAAHGQRFTYTIRSQSARAVEWLRSDGLEGTATLLDWSRLWQEVVTPVAPVPKAKTQAKKATVVKAKPEKTSPIVDAREARLARRRVQDAARRARKRAAKA